MLEEASMEDAPRLWKYLRNLLCALRPCAGLSFRAAAGDRVATEWKRWTVGAAEGRILQLQLVSIDRGGL